MSTIDITFETQELDFSPLVRGKINLVYNDGSQDITLQLRLRNGVPTTGYFQEMGWINGSSGEDEAQATFFRDAFNRYYSNVGGSKNLVASSVGNTVTITANTGSFSQNPADNFYDGNVLIVFVDAPSNNTSTTIEPTFSYTRLSSGDCFNSDFSFTATGDGAPFELRLGTNPMIDNWNGSAQTIQLPRGKTIALSLYNSSNQLKQTQNVFIPRRLREGDFDFSVSTYEDDTSDIVVNKLTNINYTDPIEYSLDAVTDLLNPPTSGNSYGSSSSYPGVPSGDYRLFLRDRYGCIIFKDISISGFQDSTKVDESNYFEVMEGQSLIFTEVVKHDAQNKKNYFNTLSVNEYVQGARHQIRHNIDQTDKVFSTQFKSAFPYHYITLHKCNGDKKDITPVLISENLGATEKYDCMLIHISFIETRVYFQGGNQYTPNTDTVIGASPYNRNIPTWVDVNRLVFINGIGYRIKDQGYDDDIGGFFTVDRVSGSDGLANVQVTYNIQDYNTYEFFLDPVDIDNSASIVIEKARDGNGAIIGNPWICENIKKYIDNDDYLLIRWSDSKNKAGIVNQSGIDFYARIKGEITAISENESETFSGDSRAYSLEQIRRENFEVLIEGISAKQVKQLNIASAFDNFSVNGINLVCKSIDSKRLDKSNLWTWKAVFDYGQNNASINPDENVYSPTTGVDGGGSSGKTPIPQPISETLYKLPTGELVSLGNDLLKV